MAEENVAKQADLLDYREAYEHLAEMEKMVLVLARRHSDVTDVNERGALSVLAGRLAKASDFLRGAYELLAP